MEENLNRVCVMEAIGIYGMMAFLVCSRCLGMRMALVNYALVLKMLIIFISIRLIIIVQQMIIILDYCIVLFQILRLQT